MSHLRVSAVVAAAMILLPALVHAAATPWDSVDAARAVASGDFALTAAQVQPMLRALAAHGITATALHTHMIGESLGLSFVHFWADGALSQVIVGLRAALDAVQ